MIDVETNQALGLEITDESVQDDQMFIPLLDQTQQNCGEEHSVYRVLADGAYDRNELFNALNTGESPLASKPGSMLRPIRPGGSPYRAECVGN